MKKINSKWMHILGASLLLSTVTVITSYAGSWQNDGRGWWWLEDNGSYPANAWCWLDGNQDGVSECYYFDENGYMLANTVTPDGYQVNGNGAWIVNGSVQTKGRNGGKLTPEEATNIIYNYNKGSYPSGHYHIDWDYEESNEDTAIIWECWPTGFQGKYIVDLNTGECYEQGPYWSPDEPLDEVPKLSYWGNLKNLN